jgi:phosphopantothenoylcysteine decarboxylase/phosphopantothenate--cysteine ligase
MAAAVADFRPAAAEAGKIEKAGREHLTLALEPTEDVLAGVASARRAEQTIVGFAAEHGEDALARARDKLERKRLDALVVNDVAEQGIGFDAADNEVTILTASRERHVPRASKAEVARAVLDAVEALRAPRGRSAAASPDASRAGPDSETARPAGVSEAPHNPKGARTA